MLAVGVASAVMFFVGLAVAWLVMSRRLDAEGQPSLMPQSPGERISGRETVVDRTGEVRQLERRVRELDGEREAAIKAHDELAIKWNRVHDWYFDEAVPDFTAMQEARDRAVQDVSEAGRSLQQMRDDHAAALENQRIELARQFEAERDAAVAAEVDRFRVDFDERERQIGSIQAELGGKVRETDALREELNAATMRWHETSSALRQSEILVEEMRQRRR